MPGYAVADRSFWLFPVIVADLKLCDKMLNRRGVDAYLGATQLKPIHPLQGYKKPEKMFSFFDKVRIWFNIVGFVYADKRDCARRCDRENDG